MFSKFLKKKQEDGLISELNIDRTSFINASDKTFKKALNEIMVFHDRASALFSNPFLCFSTENFVVKFIDSLATVMNNPNHNILREDFYSLYAKFQIESLKFKTVIDNRSMVYKSNEIKEHYIEELRFLKDVFSIIMQYNFSPANNEANKIMAILQSSLYNEAPALAVITKSYIKNFDEEYGDFFEFTSNTLGIIEKLDDITIFKFKDETTDKTTLKARKESDDSTIQIVPMIENDKNKQGLSSDIITIIEDFRSYQTDLVKMMKYPILIDLFNDKVKAFNILCKKLERSETIMSVTDFEIEWESLIMYAKTEGLSQFSEKNISQINDSKVFLDKAFNDESTDNEKILSIKALERSLRGLLPLTPEVINHLKEQIGLKELTV